MSGTGIQIQTTVTSIVLLCSPLSSSPGLVTGVNTVAALWFGVAVLTVCASLFGHSDLDRDFWNNNDSSNVQQRWSSYPPKEFLLNMSPYAPYGDPRLTPK